MITRRNFLEVVSAAGTLAALQACGPTDGRSSTTERGKLDRQAIVRRHHPHITSVDPNAVLSVGNGRFAFNVDCTGLQSLPAAYKVIPLCTMSHWGWHTKPRPEGVNPAALRLKPYPFHGRTIGYPTDQMGQQATYNYMRENPHRLHLGQIGLLLDGKILAAGQISGVDQTLSLWTGIITSRFMLAGAPVEVTTVCHPDVDGVGLRIVSPLCGARRLTLQVAFPYGSSESNGDGADWNATDRHGTAVVARFSTKDQVALLRYLDGFEYAVYLDLANAQHQGEFYRGVRRIDPHVFEITPKGNRFETTVMFAPGVPREIRIFKCAEAESGSRRAWEAYWQTGAAIDLSHCTNPRAPELERRIVLSQYLMAIHSAGELPSQETGLLCNSWYGKFHLEMHWWHSVHFALWNRWEHFSRPMSFYTRMLESSRARAKSQGFTGARWVKMTGPDGAESPSTINPLIIWQQPHPIYFAELAHRHDPSPVTVKAWAEIVEDTADFMASFAQRDAGSDRYVLGPAIRTVPENNSDADINPTYELTAWRFGLATAQTWRERAGLPRKAAWDQVLANLSSAPMADGVYLSYEGQPTYTPQWAYEHPAMLGALEALPGEGIDGKAMAATVRKVRETWDFARVWGWDFPMAAMAAARTGQPDLAIDFLLMDSPTNRYLANGCNFQRDNLPAYFPGNGGLLAAIAMMVAGWQTGENAGVGGMPGFPKNGTWEVRAEGFGRIL